MDTWNMSQFLAMELGGNEKLRKHFEIHQIYHLDPIRKYNHNASTQYKNDLANSVKEE
jgi:hypothetical protein